jgi:hypothetical protein
MIAPLDVFKLADGKGGRWIGCAETLPHALLVIRKNGAGKYLVFSHLSQHKEFYELTSQGEVVLLQSLGPS